MASVGEITAQLKLSSRQFSSTLRAAMSEVKRETSLAESAFGKMGKQGADAMGEVTKATQSVSSGMKDIKRIVSGILISQTFYQGLSAIKGAYGELRQFNESLEQTKVALKYLTGDAARGDSFLYALEDFAAKTPYTLESAAQAARQLMSMSFKDSEVLGILQTLSDASAVSGGSNDAFNRIVYALGQIRTAGKLMTRDLMQIAQAGIPVFEILQEELGLTAEQVQNIGKEGIGTMEGIEAILNGLNKRYAGAADEISATTEGLWSTIVDNSLLLGNALTTDIQASKKAFLQALGDMLADAREIMMKSGRGGVLDHMFPGFADEIRRFIGHLGSLRKAAVDFGRAAAPIFKTAFEGLIVSLNVAAPLINLLVRGLTVLMQIATSNSIVLRGFTYSLVGIGVAAGISKMVMGISASIKGLAVAAQASVWVGKLASAFRALTFALVSNPIVALIMAIAAALMILLSRIQAVRNAIKGLVGSFTGLFGFNVNEIWQPEDLSQQVAGMEDFYGGLTDVSSGLDDVGKEAANAGKAVRNKFIMAFDEVYNIDDPMSDMADNIGSIADALGNLTSAGVGGALEIKPTITIDTDSIKFPDEWENGIMLPEFVPPPPINWGTELVYAFATALEHMQTVAANAMIPLKEFGESLLPNLQLGWQMAADGTLQSLGVIDSGVLGTVASISEAINGAVPQWSSSLTNWANSLLPNMSPGLSTAMSAVTTFVDTIKQSVNGEIPPLSVVFGNFANELSPSMTNGLSLALATISGFMGDMSTNMTQPLPTLLQSLVSWVNSIAPGMRPGWASMNSVATSNMQSLQNTVREPLPTMLQLLGDWARDLAPKMQGGYSAMVTLTQNTFQKIQEALELSTPAWLQKIIDFAKGLQEKWDGMWNSATVTANGFVTDFEGNTLRNLMDKKTNFESFKTTVTGIWDQFWGSMKTSSSLANGDLGALMHTLTSDSENKFTNTGKNIDGTWSGMWSGLYNTLQSKGVDISSGTGTLMTSILNAIMGGAMMMALTFSPGLSNILQSIKDWSPSLIGEVGSAFNGLNSLSGSIQNMGRSIGDWLWRGVSGVVSGFAGRISGMLRGMTFNLSGSARFTGGISAGRSMPAPVSMAGIDTRGLPAFATGGIVSRDMIARVGEGNKREAIIPLENRQAMLPFADAVADRMAQRVQATSTSKDNDTERDIMYVGTLIADDRSLKELERRMEIIRVKEGKRRG